MNYSVHHWDIFAYSCIDGRFIKRTVDWVSEKAGDIFDFSTGAGSSKAINESITDREALFDAIETSLNIHQIKEIWLFDHIDCGAYGGSKNFNYNREEEKIFHQEKLTESAGIISQKFPVLSIKKFYIDWDSVTEV